MVSPHPALAAESLAVVTGGASGIGLAAARALASQYGMSVAIGDLSTEGRLATAVEQVQSVAKDGAKVWGGEVNVGDRSSVEAFATSVRDTFPGTPLTVLMANAGISKPPTKASEWDGWETVLSTNMYGVIHTVQTFLPSIKSHDKPALVINTGSKQGITTPPMTGPAYNASKAVVKVFTEQLAYELRADPATKRIEPKLLIPGWVFTGLSGANKPGAQKPEGAWSAEQTVDYMIENASKGVSIARGVEGCFV